MPTGAQPNPHNKRLTEAQWKAARVAFERPDRAITIQQLADQLGVHRNAVYNQAKRNNWMLSPSKSERLDIQLHNQAQAHLQAQSKAVADQVIANALPTLHTYASQKIKGWMDKAINHAESGMDRVGVAMAGELNAASLKELAISLDRFDMIGRRAFGLDDSGSMRRVPGRGGGVMPVIEAEIVPDKSGSQG